MEQRIGFGKRLGALLLDVVVVCVLALILGSTLGAALGGLGGLVAMGGGEGEAAMAMAAMGGALGTVLGTVFGAVIVWPVYFLIEGFTGYTAGKFMLGIRVASADGAAAPVGRLLGRVALKNIGTLLSLVAAFSGIQAFYYVGNIGALIIFVGCFFVLGVSRQAIHDRIMGTAVYPKGLVRKPA